MTWQASETSNIDGYNIYRSEEEKDGFKNIILAEKNITEFVDESVESGKTYYYFIRSKKDDSESESTETLNLSSSILENNNTNQQKQTAAPTQVIRERILEKPATKPVKPATKYVEDEEDPW
jgi:fibronectin type 3 domain-containing protein